jgi:hypothetical protein
VPTALPPGLARAPPRARPTTGTARQCRRGYGHGSRGGRYRAPVPRERDRQAPCRPADPDGRPTAHVVDVVIRSVDDLQPESRHQRVVERNALLEPTDPQDDVGNAVDLHRSLPVCGAATSVRRVVHSPQLAASVRATGAASGPASSVGRAFPQPACWSRLARQARLSGAAPSSRQTPELRRGRDPRLRGLREEGLEVLRQR